MLFSFLYTWIKYKVLPASLIAHNRLLVERDSKHRRITSNLGLTFRNSKWSNYARSNINLDVKNDFLRHLFTLAISLVLIIALLSTSTFYQPGSLLNPLFSVYWFAIDLNLYFQIALTAGTLATVQTLITYLYSLILSYETSVSSTSTVLNKQRHFSNFLLPKRLHKPLLLSLLQTNSNLPLLTSLCENASTKANIFTDLSFVKSLYRTTYLLQITSENNKNLMTFLEHHTSKPSTFGIFQTSTFSNAKLNSLLLDYVTFSGRNDTLNKTFNSQWTLETITSPSLNSNLNNRNVTGLFYLSSYNFQKLNLLNYTRPEFFFINNSLTSQLHLIRWNRWLYKYSLLHRSSLKTPFYLNFTKSTLSSSFYNQDLGTRNLWLSTRLTKNANVSELNAIHRNLYGNFMNTISTPTLLQSNLFWNKSPLTNLSFYETSYAWALTRFYKFNSTLSNNIISKPTLLNVHLGLEAPHDALHSTSAHLTTLFNRSFRKSTNLHVLTKTVSPVTPTPVSTDLQLPLNDVYLSYSTLTFFSKERIEVLRNLSLNRTESLFHHTLPGKLNINISNITNVASKLSK